MIFTGDDGWNRLSWLIRIFLHCSLICLFCFVQSLEDFGDDEDDYDERGYDEDIDDDQDYLEYKDDTKSPEKKESGN